MDNHKLISNQTESSRRSIACIIPMISTAHSRARLHHLVAEYDNFMHRPLRSTLATFPSIPLLPVIKNTPTLPYQRPTCPDRMVSSVDLGCLDREFPSSTTECQNGCVMCCRSCGSSPPPSANAAYRRASRARVARLPAQEEANVITWLGPSVLRVESGYAVFT